MDGGRGGREGRERGRLAGRQAGRQAGRKVTKTKRPPPLLPCLACVLPPHLQVAPSFGMRRVASSLSFSHRTTFHCHIGAGKLGLGLVVPAILRAKTPFAIIQVRLTETEQSGGGEGNREWPFAIIQVGRGRRVVVRKPNSVCGGEGSREWPGGRTDMCVFLCLCVCAHPPPHTAPQRPSKAWEPISFNPSRDPRVSLMWVPGACLIERLIACLRACGWASV